MPSSRIQTALSEGILSLPEGEIAVLRPPAGHDLAALPADRLRLSHGFRPDADYWTAAGFAVAEAPTPGAGAALVILPRSKALGRALVAQAARVAPFVIVDGQKTDGADSLFRALRDRLGDLPSLTRAHGRLFWFAAPPGGFEDWAAPPPARGPEGFVTAPGVFSEAGVDRGSALLAATLPAKLPRRIADLGAGWGYLSDAVLRRDGVESVDLIEAERLALDCARANVSDPRAAFHWADATRHMPGRPYDAVISNPPFHAGRAADASLGRAFIEAAARMLTPGGQFWMVANRHLPYEAALRERFRNLDEIGGDTAFKIFHASRPKRAA